MASREEIIQEIIQMIVNVGTITQEEAHELADQILTRLRPDLK